MGVKKLGVCYYPEHWPEDTWAQDAKNMVGLGISLVRIGEFAWSRLEPQFGNLTFEWLDHAIDVLSAEGLEIVLCTPTATPPRWMVNKYPDMFALDENGKSRGFGSRRHYCFSHEGYRSQSRRITELLASRYGRHESLVAWQTDNEYGCHDTVLSYSPSAESAFRDWLSRKYGSIESLNEAWGNVFWSMEYGSFDEVRLPYMTVTEANPSHCMDFRRFSSDQVVSFNKDQVAIIRKHSPKRDVVHNFMGRMTDFDHFRLGLDLDVNGWDSYPLGFLYRSNCDEEEIARKFRTGDPDFQAFHHDLYRATGCGRAWVMEQQPGPVNWAPNNAAPLDGMVRLWSWEALAHGMEAVNYFRWRQTRFAQEQMHAGLMRPDNELAQGGFEVRQISAEVLEIGDFEPTQAPVGLVFDYESQWAGEIQPQGSGYDYFRLVYECYRAFRRMGFDVEIFSSRETDLGRFKLIAALGLSNLTESFQQALDSFAGTVLLGPRTGDKDKNFQISTPLPPATELLPGLKVLRLETLPPNMCIEIGNMGSIKTWREFVEGPQDVVWSSLDGYPSLVKNGRVHYLAGWPDQPLWESLVAELADDAGLVKCKLPSNVRSRKTSAGVFIWNYGLEDVNLSEIGFNGQFLLDGSKLPPAGVTLVR